MPTRACLHLMMVLAVLLTTGNGQPTPRLTTAPAEAAALKIEEILATLAKALVAGEPVRGIDRE